MTTLPSARIHSGWLRRSTIIADSHTNAGMDMLFIYESLAMARDPSIYALRNATPDGTTAVIGRFKRRNAQ
jgi:hypothetical protein